MASITYDGQSFQLDGRRLWLVSGTIHYTRTPHEQWAERIHSAKLAGLNCITTDVVWSRHEPRPGAFDFTGDNDLRRFVQLLADAGMYCVLRMGPYVGGGLDLGGLPPWLLNNQDLSIRTNSQPFLEASSRFIGQVARQVRDLQATAPNKEEPSEDDEEPAVQRRGPIVLIQNENDWTCGSDDLAHAYLGELNRYLRESGFEVPIVNANNLWAGVEGEVDGWTGGGEMAANLRQLARVRPTQPRIVTEYRVGRQSHWGGESPAPMTPAELQRGLCEIISAAAQYNVEPLCGGTNMGFMGGRLPGATDRYAITSNDQQAPVRESGARGELFAPLRRVSMFASRFGRLLSHLDPRHQPAVLHPGASAPSKKLAKGAGGAPVVVYASGSQGSLVILFASGEGGETSEPAQILLPDGTVLPVYMGHNPVSWCVLDFRLAGRSTMDYCNLTPFALVGSVLVVAGPAGTPARLSINGAPLEIDVPAGEPEIVQHESITVVICADEYLDRVQVADDAVLLGAIDLDARMDPVVPKGSSGCVRLAASGEIQHLKLGANSMKAPKVVAPPPPVPKRGSKVPAAGKGKKDKKHEPVPPPVEPKMIALPTVHVEASRKVYTSPTLGAWHGASVQDYIEGTSARFASIAGPSDLTKLGAPVGYGWYRIELKNAPAGKIDLAAPECADRLHVFIDGRDAGIIGVGPGAHGIGSVSLKKGPQTLVVLAENLGRFSGGVVSGKTRGLTSHLREVRPLRSGKPALERGQPIDMLGAIVPQWRTAMGDMTDPERLTWTLSGKRKKDVLVRFGPVGSRGLVLVNDTPVRAFDASGPREVLVPAEKLGRGTNTIQLAVLGDAPSLSKELAGAVELYECEEPLTLGASWAFAKWEQPVGSAYSHKPGTTKGPAWYRAGFTAQPSGAALHVDCAGLSKGQVYVNSRHIGRYFTATGSGKPVGPQTQLLIPSPLILPGANDLVIFDEHGCAPSKVKLVYA